MKGGYCKGWGDMAVDSNALIGSRFTALLLHHFAPSVLTLTECLDRNALICCAVASVSSR